MAGEDIQSWSKTAANNGTADTSIDWQEHQQRKTVNNSARSEMAAHAKNRDLQNGSIVTTGTANAQAFLSGVGYTAMPPRLLVKLKVGVGLTNNGVMTLNMDGLGAIEVKTDNGDRMRGSEFIAGGYVDLLWDGTNWIFLYSRDFFFQLMFGGGGVVLNQVVYQTPGTYVYTPSGPGVQCCIIECIAGGGGGGCASSGAGLIVGGGGGGSGGYSRSFATAAEIGASQSVRVGERGEGGATPPSPGQPGGDSFVGTLCIARGGAGGNGSFQGGTVAPGGAGGVPGTGDITAAGNPGQHGSYNAASSTFAPIGGGGGASTFGGAAAANASGYGGTSSGASGLQYGSGGAGSGSAGGTAFSAGGPGSGGIVIITEFGGRGTPGRDGLDGPPGPIGPTGPSGPGTGDVLRSGTPSAGQVAQWTDASHIAGVSAASIVAGVAITNVVLQKFTASGSYTPTSGMKFCIIECIGGGGAGGGGIGDAFTVTGGGGGGAGGYSRKRATATEVGGSQSVIVGAAGAGSAGNGTNGGATAVGSLCVALGGGGGFAGTTGMIGGGGAGANAGTGDITATGASGTNAQYWSGAPSGFGPPAGMGANSYYGGGGQAAQGTSTGAPANGGTARGYGAGGGGCSCNNSGTVYGFGGNGSPGLVIITEFI